MRTQCCTVELTAVVGGGRALRAAVLFAVGGGQVGLGRASAEAHLAAGRGHLGHALLGLQSLRPDGTTGGKKEFTQAESLPGLWRSSV